MWLAARDHISGAPGDLTARVPADMRQRVLCPRPPRPHTAEAVLWKECPAGDGGGRTGGPVVHTGQTQVSCLVVVLLSCAPGRGGGVWGGYILCECRVHTLEHCSDAVMLLSCWAPFANEDCLLSMMC